MTLMPQSRRGALGRFALAAVIVVVFTATATAVAGLLEFKQAVKDISVTPAIKHAQVVVPEPGRAQTILLLGSDHRANQPLRAANSDTIILVRIDPDSSTINVVSIPRDLKVSIPGGPYVSKINAAYSLGGPNLVVKTIQQNVFPGLKVNHIVDINFAGFRELVNAIGCVYTDVDRRYYHVSGYGANNYSSIDIQPGYQKLCGDDALAYVRFRHTDTDIVRSARQQDFIRQAKDQYGQTNLITHRDQLLKIFGRHTQTDPNLHTTDGLINLFNLVAFSDAHAIREVHFPAILESCAAGTPCYVTADPEAEATAFEQLMEVVQPSAAATTQSTPPPPPAPRPATRRHPTAASLTDAGLEGDVGDGRLQVPDLAGAGMPILFPHAIAIGSHYETPAQAPTPNAYPRSYTIGHYAAYRMVIALNPIQGQYYGVQGTTWRNPPILAPPREIRYVSGKKLELHWDGRKLRLVALRTASGVYWISNTLSLALSNRQMLGIAASLGH